MRAAVLAFVMLARYTLSFISPLPRARLRLAPSLRLHSLLEGASSVSPPTDDAAPYVPRKFVPFPFAYHEEFEATVDSLTNLGVGVCRVHIPAAAKEEEEEEEELQADQSSLSSSRGWVVFVPSVLPGERVRVRVYRNHKSHSAADLVSVLEPSAHR